MKKILINTNELNETRLAILENGLLFNLEIENKKNIQKRGNIYKGIVTKVESSLDAVFVNYGSDKDGFLPFKEIKKEYLIHKSVLDKNLVNKGKELIVQIEKEERNTKSAALTTYLSLAGSYLVLMPSNPSIEGISRHIDGDLRTDLKEKLGSIDIPTDMGVIIRTAGVGRSLEELKWELNILIAQYKLIKNLNKFLSAPCLIHEESDIIVKFIRDYLRPDVKEVIIDNVKIFNYIYKYLNSINSELVAIIKLYSESIPLFSKYKVEQQIELAFKREIFLPSGGSIIIDNTEALISIDVNSAKSNRCTDIKETALQTNLEAISEIFRQMRLRDLGGLLVIDFIDMPDANSHRIIEKKIKELILFDRAKIQIGKISKFGLLEMSRQRIKSSLSESSQDICGRCNGTGKIDNMEMLSMKILRSIEEESLNTKQINIEIPIKLMTYLVNSKKYSIFRLEKKYDINIILIASESMSLTDYKIYKLKMTRRKIRYKDITNKHENHDADFNIENNNKNKTHISIVVKTLIKNLNKKKK